MGVYLGEMKKLANVKVKPLNKCKVISLGQC